MNNNKIIRLKVLNRILLFSVAALLLVFPALTLALFDGGISWRDVVLMELVLIPFSIFLVVPAFRQHIEISDDRISETTAFRRTLRVPVSAIKTFRLTRPITWDASGIGCCLSIFADGFGERELLSINIESYSKMDQVLLVHWVEQRAARIVNS